jgi:hypothetical protein
LVYGRFFDGGFAFHNRWVDGGAAIFGQNIDFERGYDRCDVMSSPMADPKTCQSSQRSGIAAAVAIV